METTPSEEPVVKGASSYSRDSQERTAFSQVSMPHAGLLLRGNVDLLHEPLHLLYNNNYVSNATFVYSILDTLLRITLTIAQFPLYVHIHK